MTDVERAAALADEISRDVNRLRRMDNPNDIRIVHDALRRLTKQSAPSPASADLREVVAKALAERDGHSPDDPDYEEIFGYYEPSADAALSAIQRDNVILPREPTPVMLQAAWRAFRGDRKGPLLDGAGPAFKEAIRAVLTVKETSK